jgi:hypothetical protein
LKLNIGAGAFFAGAGAGAFFGAGLLKLNIGAGAFFAGAGVGAGAAAFSFAGFDSNKDDRLNVGLGLPSFDFGAAAFGAVFFDGAGAALFAGAGAALLGGGVAFVGEAFSVVESDFGPNRASRLKVGRAFLPTGSFGASAGFFGTKVGAAPADLLDSKIEPRLSVGLGFETIP